MKIVIEIPEDAYRQIRNWGVPTDELRRKIYDIIDNGTPLPEHHGRLIDYDDLIEKLDRYGRKSVKYQLPYSPTIIKADKGER